LLAPKPSHHLSASTPTYLPKPQTPEDSSSLQQGPLEPTASLLQIIRIIYSPATGGVLGGGRRRWDRPTNSADGGSDDAGRGGRRSDEGAAASATRRGGVAGGTEQRRAMRNGDAGGLAEAAEASLVEAVELMVEAQLSILAHQQQAADAVPTEAAVGVGSRGAGSEGAEAQTEASRPAACDCGEDSAAASGNDEDGSSAWATASAQARAALQSLTARLQVRTELVHELSGVVEGLASARGTDGERLVDVPRDALLAATKRLLAERRAEFRALDGWSGPCGCVTWAQQKHRLVIASLLMLTPGPLPNPPQPPCTLLSFESNRFDQLPRGQLPSEHPDPRIAQGLARIRRLDEQLRDTTLAVRTRCCCCYPVHTTPIHPSSPEHPPLSPSQPNIFKQTLTGTDCCS